MTAKAAQSKIRPLAQSFAIEVPDEAGRVVQFRVQVDAKRLSVWTSDSDGGSMSWPEAYAACCAAKARTETR